MRMNSPTGKKILALVREGDYAHPGEEAAIGLVMRDFAPDPGRLILDVGCGPGGHGPVPPGAWLGPGGGFRY